MTAPAPVARVIADGVAVEVPLEHHRGGLRAVHPVRHREPLRILAGPHGFTGAAVFDVIELEEPPAWSSPRSDRSPIPRLS